MSPLEIRCLSLKPHRSLTAKIGQPHTFANERDQPALITIETEPAGIQRFVFGNAALIARATGVEKRLAKYYESLTALP
jgi:hypothetical protein